MFHTHFPPTWLGNSREAPPVRRQMKAAQCRTRLQTVPTGHMETACLSSLPRTPPPAPASISPFPPACFPFLGGVRQRSPPRSGACCPRACPFSRGGGRISARELSARAGHTRRCLAVMGPLARARVPSGTPAPGEKCEPPTQAGGSADTAPARPSLHKVQPGRDSGRQERVTKRRSAQAG